MMAVQRGWQAEPDQGDELVVAVQHLLGATAAMREVVAAGGSLSPDDSARWSKVAGRIDELVVHGVVEGMTVDSGALARKPGLAKNMNALIKRVKPAQTSRVSSGQEFTVSELVGEILVLDADHRAKSPDLPEDDLWGPAPTDTETSRARLSMLRRRFSEREALIAQSLTRSEVARLLGISPQAVTGYLDSAKLLGLKVKRQWAVPAWQLSSEATDGVLPDLGKLAAAFPGGIVALSRWVQKPHPDLAGATPGHALAEGRTREVLELAAAITAKGW